MVEQHKDDQNKLAEIVSKKVSEFQKTQDPELAKELAEIKAEVQKKVQEEPKAQVSRIVQVQKTNTENSLKRLEDTGLTEDPHESISKKFGVSFLGPLHKGEPSYPRTAGQLQRMLEERMKILEGGSPLLDVDNRATPGEEGFLNASILVEAVHRLLPAEFPGNWNRFETGKILPALEWTNEVIDAVNNPQTLARLAKKFPSRIGS